MNTDTQAILKTYAQEVSNLYKTGVTTEHSFRGSLQTLLNALLPQYSAVNEPQRSACGAPDYALVGKKDHQPYAYIEAKDLFDNDLAGRQAKGHKEQFDRYKQALSRVAFTDYLDFRFFVDGVETAAVSLLKPNAKGGFDIADGEQFVSILTQWSDCPIQQINSASRLAEIMAYKARLLREAIAKALESENHTDIHSQYEAFKNVLLSDLTKDGFADLYAQTIAYGMFAARLNDSTPEDFSRQEAATLIPVSNPFLRKIFQSIAGYDLDESIAWIVDDLVSAFAATNVDKIMGRYSQNSLHQDPLIHFYEDFLAAYDPKLRKSCGVYYTPQPVVSFIVRAIDEVLKRDFGLADGLADYSKIKHKVFELQAGKTGKMVEKLVHRVQILDPATGTGTFLAEAVRQIYKVFEGNEGMWPQYVEESLRPRLHGFELLMAPYTITHLKLDMLLRGPFLERDHREQSQSQGQSQSQRRTRVYLTNSLEECHPDTGSLWANWLSNESAEANAIKRDCPVMVMMGNPPYSANSTNNGDWITNLIECYKKEPGSNEKLKIGKSWINDDYVKFTRMGEYFIERNKSGVLAFINNNGFLDNTTFRGMRWHLMESFDEIYIVNLHGNPDKKEIAPDGSPDKNVFEIGVGVSINIYVKTGKKNSNQLAKVYYAECYGSRDIKYNFLNAHSLNSMPFVELTPYKPYCFFVPFISKEDKVSDEYLNGISLESIFNHSTSGSVSANDNLNISFTKEEQTKKITDLLTMDEASWRMAYNRTKDARDWKYSNAKEDASRNSDKIRSIYYRPFDTRYTCFTGNSKGLYASPQIKIMSHFLQGDNVAILTTKMDATDVFKVLVCNDIVDKTVLSSKDNASVFPLYLYDSLGERHLNMNTELIGDRNPEEFFAYIYAVLHSPSYRERYKEFLKIDFPRIPQPTDKTEYQRLVALGQQLIDLHLMHKNFAMSELPKFPQPGSYCVEEIKFVLADSTLNNPTGRVYINDQQYFDGVSETAWTFFIGGYQPAQKWLKDRKSRALTFDDIRHYQRIITTLDKTADIMQEIG